MVGPDPAAVWAELASPGSALLVDEAFGRLGPPTNTPGRSSSVLASSVAQQQQPQQQQPQQQHEKQQDAQPHPNSSAASTMASVLGAAEEGQGATSGGFDGGVCMPSLLDSPDAMHEQTEPEADADTGVGKAGPVGSAASVWAGEIAAVVVCLAGSSGVRGLEPEDEGVYFVKSVARWCPMALQQPGQGGEGQQEQGPAAGSKAGLLRELVRNADHLTPAADGRHLVSSLLAGPGVGGAGKQPGAAAVCLPAARGEAALGLGRAAYRLEESGVDGACVFCRGRRAQRLVMGWSPSGLLEVDFDDRPCGATISVRLACMVQGKGRERTKCTAKHTSNRNP
jgi:hypothetical protein